MALDSVLRFEKELTASFDEGKKYTLEERNRLTIKTYSRDFSKAYHDMLSGQVERRMRASIKMVADFWYTCWVDAGQPKLDDLLDKKLSEEELKEIEEQPLKPIQTRPHEAYLPAPDNSAENPASFLAILVEKRRKEEEKPSKKR